MPGFNDLAKTAKLNPVVCRSCGKKTPTTDNVDELLRQILDTVKKGETVRIKGFGTFKARLFKGRKLTSPLLEGGSVTFEDALVLRFHQSAAAKRYLNAPDEEAEKPAKGKKAAAKPEKPAAKAEKPAAKPAAKAEKPAAKPAKDVKKPVKKAPEPEPEEDEEVDEDADEEVDEDEEGDEDADEEAEEGGEEDE
jgi:nucleoid DNA-binding protein